jgi:hypothetical protein
LLHGITFSQRIIQTSRGSNTSLAVSIIEIVARPGVTRFLSAASVG